jgi:putative ABC transport system permease protein
MTPDPRDRRIDLPRLGRRPEAEMDQEIEAHLQLAIDDLIADGLAPEAARMLAERRFGDLSAARHQLHIAARQRDAAVRHRNLFGAIVADIRFAVRQIRRSAAHSALAVATLALGIGMTTAMFTLVERLLLRPLPFPHAEQLVALQGEDSLRRPVFSVSSQDGLDWRDQSQAFVGMAFHSLPFRFSVTTGDSATRLNMVSATGDFFGVMASRFLAGRPFTSAEVQSGALVTVVSEQVWRDYLGADPTLARPLPIGGRTYQVVGVVAAGAEYPAGTGVWLPMALVAGAAGAMRNNINYQALGRLKPGTTVEQASRDLLRVSRNIREHDTGGLYDFGVHVVPLETLVVAADVTSSLHLLMRSVLVVLLLVCANLTIATLGRGASRQQEMAVRVSLGATRGRLVTQLLVEHVLLALVGGLAGVVVAWATVRGMVAAWGDWIPRASEVHLDLTILGFAAGVSIVVGILAGLVPALRGSRVSLQQVMKQGGRTAVAGRTRIASALVIAEFALALTLLAGAGLLIHSFQRLLGRDLGFDRRLATAEIALSDPKYAKDPAQRLTTWDRLIASYRAIPGVQKVGVANWVPLGVAGTGFIDIAGRDRTDGGAGYRVVSEDYLAALGVRLLHGRGFGAGDVPSGVRTVLINQAMANKYWPNEDPIGKQVRAKSMEAGPRGDQDAPWLTIVGVVSNLRHWGFETEPLPEMYTSFRQAPQWRTSNLTAVISSRTPPSQLFPLIRARMREIDPHLAADISTMDIQLSNQLAPRRLTMTLLTGFAALALLLAALGIYAVLSYTVVQRTRELAIRSALGAQRGDLLAMVVRNGAITAGAGIVLGIGAAVALSRLLQAMVVDVTTLDPLAFAGAVVVLGIAGSAAILIPALRATRMDPVLVMKGE